jgi:chemotaxis protein MotA
MGFIARAEMAYLAVIKQAILGSVKADSPLTCVEFARRNVEPATRPTFAELEELVRVVKEANR